MAQITGFAFSRPKNKRAVKKLIEYYLAQPYIPVERVNFNGDIDDFGVL